MVRGFGHLSDERLIEVCMAEALPPREQQHLQRCQRCIARRADLEALLADVSSAASAEADAAFPSDRLARQHARILHRVSQAAGRPARVIAFPGHAQEPDMVPVSPRTRWVAAAAAAGLVIGLVAGHMSRDFPAELRAPAMERPTSVPQPNLRAVNAAFSEEELLGQIELAVASPSGSSLGTLNDLTPRAWEVK